MKKILSTILSISIVAASSAVPVLADYTAPETSYDVEKINLTYDDGEATNSIDGSKAAKITDTAHVFDLTDNTIMTKEFYLAFDFCFDTVDGTVPGSISIYRRKNDGSMNKQGPLFSYSDGNLRTQTGSSSYQTIASISPDTWYTAEIEGKMVVATANCDMRVYDAEHNLVGEINNLNIRQFYAGASNGNPDTMTASNVSIDNVKLIQEYPDEVRLTSVSDDMNAGTTNAFGYTLYRMDKETTKYDVTWSVEGATDDVTINQEGVLIADISAPTQTVTVKATTVLEKKELSGEKQITINAVSTESEKFDTIVLSGDDTVKAGENGTYTFTASKGGTDVTETVTEADVVWQVYNCDDLNPNNNKGIKLENGVLKVDDSVLPQTIYVRAVSPSGNVYGSKAVEITISDKQSEPVIYSNACEITADNMERVESVDGSTAYKAAVSTGMSFGNHSEYTLTELDIKFDADYSGIVFKRADGTINSSFYYRNGGLAQQTGSSNYSVLMGSINADSWYHLQILYTDANTASINVYEYDGDGNMNLVYTGIDINRRNSKAYGQLAIESGTIVDNIKVTTAVADSVTVTAPSQYMFAGETAQFTATATRAGLPLKNYGGLKWKVLDSKGLPIIDDSVTVDDTGLVTVDSQTPAQTVTIRAESAAGYFGEADITIQISEIFTVTNLGINEKGTAITKVYADKNFYYNDDVVFIITIKSADGVLKAVKLMNTFGDRLSLGSNEISTDFILPADFNAETDRVEAMVWTLF